MAPRSHHLTRALLVASALLLVLVGGLEAEPAPGHGVAPPLVAGTPVLEEAPELVADALASAALGTSRWAVVLLGPAVLTLALAFRRRRTIGHLPWRPVVRAAPADRAPPRRTS